MTRSTRAIWVGSCILWSICCALEAAAADGRIASFQANAQIWRVDDRRWESIEARRDALVLGGWVGLVLAGAGMWIGTDPWLGKSAHGSARRTVR